MNERSRPLPVAPQASIPLPLTAWWSGFDYIFGYQIKLVQEFWGVSPEQ